MWSDAARAAAALVRRRKAGVTVSALQAHSGSPLQLTRAELAGNMRIVRARLRTEKLNKRGRGLLKSQLSNYRYAARKSTRSLLLGGG